MSDQPKPTPGKTIAATELGSAVCPDCGAQVVSGWMLILTTPEHGPTPITICNRHLAAAWLLDRDPRLRHDAARAACAAAAAALALRNGEKLPSQRRPTVRIRLTLLGGPGRDEANGTQKPEGQQG